MYTYNLRVKIIDFSLHVYCQEKRTGLRQKQLRPSPCLSNLDYALGFRDES